ncbi:MAG TPA: nucleoside monophosphate kinase [Candidatus Saccharibacteria bacterium]|jgi:adenylate kinase|nr:nucleoside monophosphate kinase [Candidatus Saccharibacteria bacterium]
MYDASGLKKIEEWLGTGSINIFGLPFAGKDTQGSMLAEAFNGVLISSGDILRHDHGNQKVHDLMAAGAIIPSELFLEIVIPYLSRSELQGRPLILSEVGRVQGEAEATLEATKQSGHETKVVFFLNMPEQEVWRRFDASQQSHDRGPREDDNRNVLQNRLNRFREKVLPVIEFYRNSGLLVEIDGSLEKSLVTGQILRGLYDKSLGN